MTDSDECQNWDFAKVVSRGFVVTFARLLRFCLLPCALCLLSPDVWLCATDQSRTPIFVYHRFGPIAADSMTVTVALFEAQLKYLRDNGYQVIPLRQWVEHRLNDSLKLPPQAVVITADDAHRSLYTYLLPLAQKYRVPVTLFVYPSAISNADYALTWVQLSELQQTGLFDVQSHSYWHPNFKQEKRRLGPHEYEKFVYWQLNESKNTLERRLAGKVDLLAWPFGIFDDELIKWATAAGYTAGFTIEGRHATARDPILAVPRYLVTQAFDMKVFAGLMAARAIHPGRGF